MAYQLKRNDLLYTDLTDIIIKAVFEVYSKLGDNLLEKHYQRALAIAFSQNGLSFRQQVLVPLSFNGLSIGRYFLDFLVEGNVAVELKKDNNFGRKNIDQLHSYLKATNLELGLLINFTKMGVRIKRVVNLQQRSVNSD